MERPSNIRLETEIQERVVGVVHEIGGREQEEREVAERGQHSAEGNDALLQLRPEPRIDRESEDAADKEDREVISEIPEERAVHEWDAGHTEHDPNVLAELCHIVENEDDEAENDDEDRIKVLKDAREFFESAAPDVLFECEENTIVETPEHEVPGGAMPETGQEPDDEHVPELFQLAVAVAAERDVDIITEPGAERDVPAAPEVGDRDRTERIVEVLEVVEAEHAAHTDRHVTIGAEVEVELEREAETTEPGTEHGDRCARTENRLQRSDGGEGSCIGRGTCGGRSWPHRESTCLDELPDGTDGVCEEDLLEETLQEAETALDEAVEGDGTRVQLFVYRGETDDRARDQLWEHRHVGEVVEVVFLDRDFALIEVDGIAHGLEGEEADADRETELQRRDRRTGKCIDRLHQKIGILKEAEAAEVDENRQQQA